MLYAVVLSMSWKLSTILLLGANSMQSSAYADVDIWSSNEKERSCWRDGRGIREIREKMSKKMGGKMRRRGGDGPSLLICQCGCEMHSGHRFGTPGLG